MFWVIRLRLVQGTGVTSAFRPLEKPNTEDDNEDLIVAVRVDGDCFLHGWRVAPASAEYGACRLGWHLFKV